MADRRLVSVLALPALVAVFGACSGSDAPRTPPAAAVALGPTSTTASPDDPPIVIGGAPGTDGHLQVRLNPSAWEGIKARLVDDDPRDPYYELHSDGHDEFWFGVELHTVVGPGWTGEVGLFATDCVNNGICVRFDPDGGAGPMGPMLAGPLGEIDIEQLEDGFVLGFRNLVFD
ncbi:MAG TPA: hypothetical protein VM618_11100, partial [Acidimicrobiia bacterium]|nr:hypothetical protein [Acidimicrobiia bacterium]